MISPRRPLILFLICAAILAGCGSGLNIPKPSLGAGKPLPPLEPSVIEIPVTINLQPIFKEIESQVPREQRASKDWTIVDKNVVGDLGIKYEVRRDPLRFAVLENKVRVDARVLYWFEAAQRVSKPLVGGHFWQEVGSCGRGEQLREALIGLETSVSWSPEWALTSKTVQTPTKFTNQCKVTFLKINVTDKVEEAFDAGLKKASSLADSRLQQAGNMRSLADRIWKGLQEPVQLDSGLWLIMEPEAAHIGPLKGSGESATAVVGLTARPRIVLGNRPTPAPRALPKLQMKGTSPGGFHVAIEGELTYEEATRELARRLNGSRHTVGGRDVEVRDIRITGVEGGAVLQLTLAGDIDGTIYLTGRPVFDPKTSTLSVADLDYSIETKQVLLKVADWLNHEGFRRSIAEQAKFPLADHIADVKARIEKGLTRSFGGSVQSTGTVTAIRPLGVYMTSTAFTARVAVDGNVRIDVR